jgi:general secretion pathway protein D
VLARRLVIAWIVMVGPVVPVSAQPADPLDERQRVELAGDLEASRLVELVGERLGVSMQYQQSQLSQRVTLRLREAVTDDELWQVMTATLESVGLVVVEGDAAGVYRIVPIQQAAQQSPRLLLPGDAAADDPGAARPSYLATVVRLESADAAQAAQAVGPLLTPNAGVARPIGDGGLLLLADVRRRVEQAMRVLELIDRPRDPVATFVVALEEAPASEVAQLAGQILQAKIAVGGAAPAQRGATLSTAQVLPLPGDDRVLVVAAASREAELRRLIADLDEREALVTRTYAAAGVEPQALADSIRTLLGAAVGAGPGAAAAPIAVDALTGQVFVTAPASRHARIEALVASLRDQPPASRRTLRSFVIRNRDAEEVRSTLAELLSEGVVTTAPAPDGAEPADPAPVMVAREVSLTVDAATNTILAVGEQGRLDQLGGLIAELDRRQAQVMIEVQLVSLSEGEARDLGVELAGQFSIGSTDVNLSSLFGLSAGGSPGSGSGGGTGFSGSVINPGDFQALIRAVETVNNGRSVSSPKVLVNNNATATLRSVNRQPFTSINASDTVATTSFGGTEDAGTTVTLTPQIAEGDHLVLEYAIELSAFTGEATTVQGGGVIPPPSQQNSLQGSVTIPDGFTVVLGGVQDAAESESQTRVPLIGRLPLIGALFRSQSDSETKARFYVFIRPIILRDPAFADLRLLSESDIARAGVDDGAPALDPVWVD